MVDAVRNTVGLIVLLLHCEYVCEKQFLEDCSTKTLSDNMHIAHCTVYQIIIVVVISSSHTQQVKIFEELQIKVHKRVNKSRFTEKAYTDECMYKLEWTEKRINGERARRSGRV